MTIDIEALNTIIDNYDEALTQVVKEGWIEEYRPSPNPMEQFNLNFQKLKDFAQANPLFNYYTLGQTRGNILGYFYSEAILHAERAERKAYEKRMKRYDTW